MSMRADRHNVLSVLREAAGRHPERLALAMEGRRATFAELWDRVDRASAGFRRLGLAPGDRAIVMIPMSIDLYAVLLGLLKMGAVAVFVDPWIGWRQIAAFAAFAEPRAFAGTPRAHLLRLASGRLRRLPVTVTTGRRLGALPAARTLSELLAEPGDGEVQPVAADDSALVTFTSGSSGEPKGADRTHRFLLAQHRALAAELPAREGDVDMPTFPVFALNNLAGGVPSVVPAMDFRRVERVDARRVLAQMRAHGVTTCTASPPFFDRLAARLAERPEECPALRRVLTGGAPVSDGQLRAWARALPETEVLVAYGSTEAEPVAHVEADERLAAVHDRRPLAPGYCAGRPVAGVRARLVRIHAGPIDLAAGGWEGWELPAGEVEAGGIGELAVAGDHVGRGYFRNPGAERENKIVEPDGVWHGVWHRMGDTGSFDSAGRFWIAGRVHSTIRRAGALVHPQLVEQAALGDDPRILRAAAVGLPDPALGEKVAVVLELAPGAPEREALAAAAERLAAAGQPVDALSAAGEPLPVDPRHRSKIDYERLRARLLKGGG